ncbi:hypothetical protein B0A58_12980 [Flavobacterium branchiophilum NBRC 15030 = ATCC 35035]|uniref:Uncharacterized protein n=1 Tax=Flavobacterium branchiophilum TaxID=55197 RepID=A0A543G3J5_9FLAO|nr:hypothetical protein [Flavobacterium branchiophilum]OXA72100.1 hypothetical protein B0A58_12980 [Flavobacterium branchiophilum NBRC 15030 = ATCC 35035]TQM40663.1 hypothetical protein BC670_1566 [Flavobacterium branchiophilum]GEM54257.1 hypothetical protein FB1_04780 [Flavobacterium branchiophilum NBRC 15030 = ATCC 35035]
MENKVIVQTENGIITTIDGLPFLEFQAKVKNEFRAKALLLMQIDSEDFNKMIFKCGCKIESQNTHPNSKGITKQKAFWDWLNHEIDCLFYTGVDAFTANKLTINQYKNIFIGGIEKFIVQDTINHDLSHLITIKTSDTVNLDSVLNSKDFE